MSIYITQGITSEFKQAYKELYIALYKRDLSYKLSDEFQKDSTITIGCYKGDKILALCSVFIDCDICKFGFIEFHDDAEAINLLHERLVFIARSRKCKSIVGPLNRNTWSEYRWAMPNDYPLFFTETLQMPYYLDRFKSLAYVNCANYYSNLDKYPELTEEFNMQFLNELLFNNQIRIRNINLNKFDDEISRIYHLSMKLFSNNYLFQYISLEEFIAKYKIIMELIDPSIIYIAEDSNSDICAFLFALHNKFDLSGIILKTIACKSGRKYAGITRALTAQLVKYANQNSKYIIHAFMHESNVSKIISNKLKSVPIRKYVLLEYRITD